MFGESDKLASFLEFEVVFGWVVSVAASQALLEAVNISHNLLLTITNLFGFSGQYQ